MGRKKTGKAAPHEKADTKAANKAGKKAGNKTDNDADLWARFTHDVAPTKRQDRAPPASGAPDAPGAPGAPDAPDAPGAPGAPDAPDAPDPNAPPRRIARPGPAPKPLTKPVPTRSHGDTPGVDGRTATKLKRGLLPIDGTLDLHGMTRAEAEDALNRFIQARQSAGARCVLVITGKGLNQGGVGDWSPGVLRQAVPGWLNAPPLAGRVLGFSYAQPRHGGSGALYVLLKRLR